MSLTVQNNLSALQAFSKQMAVSANNVANALSDDFKSSKAYNVEGEKGRVETSIVQDSSPGPLVEDPLKNDGSLKELSNTDIAQELVQQIASQHGFDANAKVIQAYDQTLGSLINTFE